jgi:hypothetical protein
MLQIRKKNVPPGRDYGQVVRDCVTDLLKTLPPRKVILWLSDRHWRNQFRNYKESAGLIDFRCIKLEGNFGVREGITYGSDNV